MSRRVRKLLTINADDDQLERIQSHIEEVFESIADIEVTDGRLIKSISLISGQANEVSHGLGRSVEGWQVVRQRADARIWDNQDSNKKKNLTLDLRCSANVTVDLWVF